MYQKESEEVKLSSLLHEKNDELQSQLDNAHKQFLELQAENKKVLTKYMELKDKKRHYDDMVCIYIRASYDSLYVYHYPFHICIRTYTTVVTIL